MAHMAREVLIEYIKENQEKLYRIAYTYTKNQEIALDVVQEAITKSLGNINKLRAEEYKKAVLATGGTMEDYIPTQINVDYKITYQDENLVSFVITKSESSASAYQEQYFYNIDIENGKELNLRDVLGENYKEIIDDSVNKQIKERTKEDKSNVYFTDDEGGFSGIENEYQDFYINENKKVTVVFQKYEIAPGYMGIQNFEIPNEII